VGTARFQEWLRLHTQYSQTTKEAA
jgi:hypothetical protein